MEIGSDVDTSLKQRVYDQFTSYVGEDSVFPTKNGSPKILTKFVDHPYSYELLPEYERGEKKMPCTKTMNWEGKAYSSLVIRGFIRGTPVVEKCFNPRCISRLDRLVIRIMYVILTSRFNDLNVHRTTYKRKFIPSYRKKYPSTFNLTT
jgi:hypothetical protein